MQADHILDTIGVRRNTTSYCILLNNNHMEKELEIKVLDVKKAYVLCHASGFVRRAL
jgi:hypothetical protein